MPDFLTASLGDDTEIDPLRLVIRLTLAMVLGGLVALVYRRTRTPADVTPSFPPTLVLLAILIAMVTQVVGNNAARAFSLVGALSIVRFRTVVRDTQDTAYVIFAVVIGMAVGANHLWMAFIGLVVVAIAAALMSRRPLGSRPAATPATQDFLLTLRVGLASDLETVAGSVLNAHLADRRLVEMATAKQGVAINAAYVVRFSPPNTPEQLVKALNRIEGIHGVELQARGAQVDDW